MNYRNRPLIELILLRFHRFFQYDYSQPNDLTLVHVVEK